MADYLGILRSKGINLPAMDIAGQLIAQLRKCGRAIVTAEPGAGKSTILPLAMLPGLDGKILMLEPRRLAARGVAERMAETIDEECGDTVGYRIRFENRTSDKTRIEVLTERILTRMLVDDPTMCGVAAVVFDEFHERSLDSDLALALCLECQKIVRPDLKIVIMSASIDAAEISEALNAPVVKSEGRLHPVEVIYSKHDIDQMQICSEAVRTVREVHRSEDGDILVFLPGEAEIRKCAEALEGQLGNTSIFPLYGMLPQKEQKMAIAPSLHGHRKVVLATPIAETSLTIEGVRTVVDSGLYKKLVFNPITSLSRLETVPISRDMAIQRTGRAGRVAAGKCYRLWTQASEVRMQESRIPEIRDADLSGLVLDVAAWGESNIAALPWLTVPPPANVRKAEELLEKLGSINGKITQLGKQMAAMPCHPRIARMLIAADNEKRRALSADLAALLEEKDPLPQSGDTDIALRINALRQYRSATDCGTSSSAKSFARIERIAQQYLKLVHTRQDNTPADQFELGYLLARAYPERIARSVDGGRNGKYLLSSGDYATVERNDIISSYEWIVAANLMTKNGGEGRIFLASPVSADDLLDLAVQRDNIGWDSRRGSVIAQTEWRIGRLSVLSKPISCLTRDMILEAICKAAPKEGLSMFDFNDNVANLQRRISVVASWHKEMNLPDVSTDSLLQRVGEWLPFYIGNASSTSELKKIDMCEAIWSLISYEQRTALERLAPAQITLPCGRRARIEYRPGAEAPVVRARLQDCFGLMDTPRVNDGKTAVLMELLSPGFKPVQLTSDLKSFWSSTYFEVRKELRRRYPKHSWPEDPKQINADNQP